MATIYTGINQAIEPFQARIFADGIDVHDSVFDSATNEFTPPHRLRPCTRFQWYHNGTALTGETSDTYTVPVTAVSFSGEYYCIITIGDDPNTCISEQTETRTVSIVDCGPNTAFNVDSGTQTTTVTINHRSGEAVSVSTDANWITGSVNTSGGTSTVTFTTTTQAAARAAASVLVGEYTCIYAFTQDYVPQAPPPALPPPPTEGGPYISDIENDGPNALSISCRRFNVEASSPGFYQAVYTTCIGEDATRGFTSSTDIIANNFGQSNLRDFRNSGATFTITEGDPIEAFSAVIITPVGAFEPDDATRLAAAEFTFTVNGTPIPRTAHSNMNNAFEVNGGRFHYLFDDNERVFGNRLRAPIVGSFTTVGTWNLGITLTSGSQTVEASDTFEVISVDQARTDGTVTGDTQGSTGACGTTTSGTFQVTEGTGKVTFMTAGVPIGTSSSNPLYVTTSSDFTYTVTGNGINETDTVAITGNTLRNVPRNPVLESLPVGTYTWTIGYDNCNTLLLPGTSPVGRILVEGNTFF